MMMETRDIVYITAEVVVGVVSVIGNCIVLAAIIKTKRLHTITNVFVGSLAIADILVGLLVAPCAGLSFMGLPPDFYGCVFINSVILMFTNVSILMLLAVAIERFLAIKEPFLYERVLTVQRAVYFNLLVWLLGCLLGLMPMYGWNKGYHEVQHCMFVDVITYPYMVYFQFFGLVLVPLFIMFCIYMYILVIVRRHMRQTNALNNMFRQGNQPRQSFNKDVKAAKMFALVILLFGLFWFPVNIFNCVSLFCPTCIFPYESLLVAIVMSHANSTINPFLYAATNTRIKEAIKGLFGISSRPGDRSSTDMPPPRVSNGVTRARDNTVHPTTLNTDNISNNGHDTMVRPFTITHGDFTDGDGKISSHITTGTELTVTAVSTANGYKKTPSDSAGYHLEGGDSIQQERNTAKFDQVVTASDSGQSHTSHPQTLSRKQNKGEESISEQQTLQETKLSALLNPTAGSEESKSQNDSPILSHNQLPYNGHSNPAFVSDDSVLEMNSKTRAETGSNTQTNTQTNTVSRFPQETDHNSGDHNPPSLTKTAWNSPEKQPGHREDDEDHHRPSSALSHKNHAPSSHSPSSHASTLHTNVNEAGIIRNSRTEHTKL